ncbi:hypothetical protein NHH03_13080 [Stieleria sp. TO1_6]|nr:hypothetical protein [Stieleria tagensis]
MITSPNVTIESVHGLKETLIIGPFGVCPTMLSQRSVESTRQSERGPGPQSPTSAPPARGSTGPRIVSKT